MKKFPNPNVQRGTGVTLQPSHKERVVYDCMRGEECEGNVHGMAYCGEQDGRFCEPCANHRTKNVGGENASAVGCKNNSCYFKEYHVTNDEACDVICEDIDDDMLNQLD